MSTDTDSPSSETPPADLPASAKYAHDVLAAADEPLTQAEIREQTHFAQATISTALGQLDERGLLETADAPALAGDHAGRPPQYYRLTDTSTPQA